jgi:hypothetical protein
MQKMLALIFLSPIALVTFCANGKISNEGRD